MDSAKGVPTLASPGVDGRPRHALPTPNRVQEEVWGGLGRFSVGFDLGMGAM